MKIFDAKLSEWLAEKLLDLLLTAIDWDTPNEDIHGDAMPLLFARGVLYESRAVAGTSVSKEIKKSTKQKKFEK
jgi:hypothetical protein